MNRTEVFEATGADLRYRDLLPDRRHQRRQDHRRRGPPDLRSRRFPRFAGRRRRQLRARRLRTYPTPGSRATTSSSIGPRLRPTAPPAPRPRPTVSKSPWTNWRRRSASIPSTCVSSTAPKKGPARPTGPLTPKVGYIETLEATKAHPHYSAPRDGKKRGRGVASGFWGNNTGPSAAVALVNPDGTVTPDRGFA